MRPQDVDVLDVVEAALVRQLLRDSQVDAGAYVAADLAEHGVHLVRRHELTGTDRECDHADAKHGQQIDMPDGTGEPGDVGAAELAKRVTEQLARTRRVTWRHVLLEEVREALAETDPDLLAAELVQVEAVCARWRHALKARQERERSA